LCLLLLAAACSGNPEPAELLLLNGAVHTVNDRQPHAEAVAVQNGRIVFVGSRADSEPYQGPQTHVVDLAGKTVVPGFADSHLHLSGVGRREMTLNLEGCRGLGEMLGRVRERVAKAEPGEWIVGRGWIEARWDPPLFPTRWDLDKVAPQNPVWLVRVDGHGAVTNSLALRVAGIRKGIPNPPGGEIMRDPKSGEPNGMLLDRAQSIVARFLPEDTPEARREALVIGARVLAERGWTQVGIAGNSFEEVELIRRLYQEGKIPLRIYNAIRGPSLDADRLIDQGPSIGEFEGRFTVRGIKAFADGALGSKGAALFEKYNDHDSTGLLLSDEETLLPLYVRALKAGIQIQTHAIGDRANRFVLDLYEKAFSAVPAVERKFAEPRWRIEHAQVVHPDDFPRFAGLGVIPSMQPSHAITDMYFAKSRLGVERLAGAYAWRRMRDAGSIIAGGSDAPVEKGDPLVEFYAAVARKDLEGKSQDHWHPEQALSREEALQALTIWPAYAAFEEDRRGSIAVGKWADLTVLSQDIMTVPEQEIPGTQIEMTIVAGEVVYERAR
jgi:predicted amidohydrolase YtcJ